MADPLGLAQECRDIAKLAGATTDAGLLARLIYLESTTVSDFVGTYQTLKRPTQPMNVAYMNELNAIAATVFNRVTYVKTHNYSGGFSQHGATIPGVIGAKNQYQGMGDQSGNVSISGVNQHRINSALDSPCNSTACFALLFGIYVANSWEEGTGYDPFGGRTLGMFQSPGSPTGNWVKLGSFPGSGNTFFAMANQ
jgi:hypothetical protein